MDSTMATSDELIARAYALKDPDEAAALYDDWATKYNDHMKAQDYIAPQLVAKAASEMVDVANVKFLDAGCGTGLVGAALSQLGAQHIDGVDYSAGMLTIARKSGFYQKLERVDLSKPIANIVDDEYDAIVCSGTLTTAHVGPSVLAEFVRITKPGGYIVATVHNAVWGKGGFRVEVERLVKDGKAELRSADEIEYRLADGVNARLLVLQIST